MSAWKFIRRFLAEARRDPVDALVDYVEQRYNGNEADELRKFIDAHRDDVPAIRRHVRGYFVDRQADKLADAIPQPQGKGQGQQHRGPAAHRPTGGGGNGSTDKGSGPSEPIPQRPDRAGTRPNTPAPSPTVLTPGEKPAQAVGSAGMHQKAQSYAMKPSVKPSSSADASAKSFSPVQKPNFKGSFVGQHWAPSAYSAPDDDEKAEIEAQLQAAIDKAKSVGDMGRVNLLRQRMDFLKRRQGGFKKRSTQHPSAATGQMVRAGVSQNPANPRGVVLRRDKQNVSWDTEHPGWWWAGDEYGWVTKSEFASLVGAGKLKRQGA